MYDNVKIKKKKMEGLHRICWCYIYWEEKTDKVVWVLNMCLKRYVFNYKKRGKETRNDTKRNY